MKKISILIIASLIMTAGFFSTASAGEIPIGIWGTLSGTDTDVNGMSYGPRDFLTYANEKFGGVMGHKYVPILLDGKNAIPEEVKVFKRLADVDRAIVINGWSTGGTKALRDQINTLTKIPYLGQTLTKDVLDPKLYPFIFLIGPTYEDQVVIGLNWAKQQGAKTFAFLHADIEYGRGPVRTAINEKVPEKLGLTIVGDIEYPGASPDFTSQLLRIQQLNPDYIYIQDSVNNTIKILRDAAKVGVPASKFIGNCYNFSHLITDTAGKDAEGFKALQINADWGEDIPLMKEIMEFKKTHKVAKEDTYYVKGWVEGKIIHEAVSRVLKKTGGKIPELAAFRQMVRDEWENIEEFDTGGGTPPLTYKGHQGHALARILEVKGGKYVPISDWIESN
ncbi:MAG: branched-chain amino acid ABC transporter substrate-binding protein [Desulfobacteraceae bacterium]|nr:MAG: branched-chain amino acid ABC transporter substrate-binding protein [Desulfobacteraceae bacterium]